MSKAPSSLLDIAVLLRNGEIDDECVAATCLGRILRHPGMKVLRGECDERGPLVEFRGKKFHGPTLLDALVMALGGQCPTPTS